MALAPIEARQLPVDIFDTGEFLAAGKASAVLEGRDLTDRVAILNKRSYAYDETIGTVYRHAVDEGATDNLDVLPAYQHLNPAARREVTSLIQTRQAMEGQVASIGKLVDTDLADEGAEIREKYYTADWAAEKLGVSLIERFAMRVAMMGGKMLPVSDYDGTWTDGDGHIKLMPTDSLEVLLKQLGRERFLDATIPTVHSMMHKDIQTLRDVGRNHVKIRDGVNEFILFSNQVLDARPIILSANYDQFVHAGLEQVPNADGNVRTICVTGNSIISTHKDIVLNYLARTNIRRATGFSGDGGSDKPAIAAADNIAVMFALEGEGFARECQAANVPHLTYKSYHDVTRGYAAIMSEVPQARQNLINMGIIV